MSEEALAPFSDILRILELSSVYEEWLPRSQNAMRKKGKELEFFLSQYYSKKEAKKRAQQIIAMALTGELSIEKYHYL